MSTQPELEKEMAKDDVADLRNVGLQKSLVQIDQPSTLATPTISDPLKNISKKKIFLAIILTICAIVIVYLFLQNPFTTPKYPGSLPTRPPSVAQ